MGKQFLDSEILNYTIKNLVSQIDKTFLKKNVLFNVTPAYYRLFNSVTDNPSDKLTVIANGLTPTTGQVTSDTVRFITKNPSIYAVGAEVVFIEEVMTPKFDNIKGITENELKTLKADTKNNRQNKYNSNILFVVDDTKLVFYDRTLDTFTDCTSGEKVVKLWQSLNNYKVGDVVKYNNHIYECIIEHTSNAIFDNDESSKWNYKMEVYYNLTKDEYDYMVVNGLIDDDTKELYIVDDGVNPLGDIYEETIGADKASNIWTIHHKLATEWYKLNITLLDSDNNIIYGDIDLDNTTINQIVFRFSEPVSGIVYIKK